MTSPTIKKDKAFIIIILSIYITGLILASILIYNRFYDIPGYETFNLNKINLICGFLLLITTAYFIPNPKDRASSAVLWFVFYFHIIPSVLFFHSVTNYPLEQSLIYITTISISFSFICLLLKKTNISITRVKIKRNTAILLFVLLSTIIFISLYEDFGINTSPPSLFKVYDIRSQYKEKVSNLNGYLVIWGGYLLAPFSSILSFVFWKKNRLISLFLILISFFFSFYIYSISGFKSVAFIFLITATSFFYFSKFQKTRIGTLISIAFLLLLILAYILHYFVNFDDLLYHWVRRSLIIPGVNSAFYFDYEYNYSFNKSIDYAPNIISLKYYDIGGSANTGIVGDGIFRFGIYLFWIEFLILAIYVKTIDIVAGDKSKKLIPLFIPISYALANSTITSILTTYALLPMLLLVYIFSIHLKN